MAKTPNLRALAAHSAWQVIDQGQSLDANLELLFQRNAVSAADRGLIQEMVYGICRWYGELDAYAAQLLNKPIRPKDRVLHFLLLLGLYQLQSMRIPAHAAVSECVDACAALNKNWAKKMINGCLRRWQREHQQWTLNRQQAVARSHPRWLLNEIKTSWPDHWREIIAANNQRPPLCLRVNQTRYSRQTYLELLAKHHIEAVTDPNTRHGIRLSVPMPVQRLPEFSNGAVSVQDSAAQLAAEILKPVAGQSVLDACAAPGGKAAHLLEIGNNQINLDAVDVSESRAEKINETLQRLHLRAQVFIADATRPPVWSPPENGYHHILIDAPCSGSGVLRRHPDIKHHRRPSDIEQLNRTQFALLSNLWPWLKPGGQLLYMTCSILGNENQLLIQRFLAEQDSAKEIELALPRSIPLVYGQQTLPGVHDMDGFYFCLLRKMAA